MSRISKTIAVLATTLTCALLGHVSPAAAAASVPQTLTQQGRLLDSDGSPVSSQLLFTFSLYTTDAGGTAIWTENQSITPDDGYFSAKLGDTTAFTPDIFDGSHGKLYLGIKIGADAEMAPRQEVTSVPFALLALNALSANHAALADLATKATSATNADKATLATTATLATNATSADTVKSIVNNLTLVGAGQSAAGQQIIACPANQLIVGGFCSPSGTGAYVSNSGFYPSSSDAVHATKKYTCACAGSASCSVVGSIVCAK
jgi:hypothetical protein